MNRAASGGADDDDEDGPVWRAFPVRTSGFSAADLERRIAEGTDPETPEEYIFRVRCVAE